MSKESFECLDWETRVTARALPNDGIRITVDNMTDRGFTVNLDRISAEDLHNWLGKHLAATA